MAVWGFAVPVTCSECGGSFLYELACSHSQAQLNEARDSGQLLCEECWRKRTKTEPPQPRDEICVLALSEADYALFTQPIAELYECIRRDPGFLRQISARQFEELVADILRNHGFDAQTTPPTRDGGIDIIACWKSPLGDTNRYFVECKHWDSTHRVGIGVVQRMLGVVYAGGATKGMVVSSSFFTSPARRFEQEHHYQLSLHDYDDLVAWIRAICGHSSLPRYQLGPGRGEKHRES
jgi:hypothetical protein